MGASSRGLCSGSQRASALEKQDEIILFAFFPLYVKIIYIVYISFLSLIILFLYFSVLYTEADDHAALVVGNGAVTAAAAAHIGVIVGAKS